MGILLTIIGVNNSMKISNLSLTERAKYAPETFPLTDLADLMEELEAWQTFAYDHDIESPDDAKKLIAELEENQANPDHADYDDLKQFFDGCVGSLNSHWPCAEVHDQNLCQVIFDAIARGDVSEEE